LGPTLPISWLVLRYQRVTVDAMKRTKRCSVEHWAIDRLSFRSFRPRRQQVRKRRIPLPRQTRGLELDAFGSYGVREMAPLSRPQAIEREASKSPQLVGRVLWICVIILGLILFGDLITRFFREAAFAWPSINGAF